MRRLSFRIANEDDAIFVSGDGGRGGGDGGRGGLQLSRVSIEATPSYLKHRRSFCRSSSSVSTALSIVSSRKSFSYDKLAQAPIHLTIVKLDASSFEIEVVKMAKISDLKQSVESAFSHLPTKGPGKVSWRHVWAQFCLSFRGQKLLNDADYIKDYGIRDGDEGLRKSFELQLGMMSYDANDQTDSVDKLRLHFVRHVSIAYNLIKKRSAKRIESPKPCAMPSKKHEVEMSKIDEDDDNDLQNLHQVKDNSSHDKPMLSQLFRGWFLYSRVSSTEHVKLKGQANQSRWPGGLVRCLRSLYPFCDNRPSSYSSRVSQIEF